MSSVPSPGPRTGRGTTGGRWPRSSAIVAISFVSFAFGAFSFVPLVGAAAFYPSGTFAGSSNFVTRSAIGDVLQIFYQLLLVEFGYLMGRRVAFERDNTWLLLTAYLGGVVGYFLGLPGFQTTTVAGGIFLFQSNLLDPVHIQSAFFNSPSLMGALLSGIGLSFVMQRRRAPSRPAEGGDLTTSGRLLLLFFAASLLSFLGYLMQPIFYLLFSSLVGSANATTGTLYGITTNSAVIANPLLLFAMLYALGGRVKLIRDAGTALAVIFVALVVGVTAGNPVGSYFTSYVVSGTGSFPNYFASITFLTTFASEVAAVSFAATLIGFAAIAVAATRRLSEVDRPA